MRRSLIVGFAGLVMMLRMPRVPVPAPDASGLADRRLALELLFVMVPYLLTATSYAMWWAGWSAPARFANPAVLILAIPCAVAWSRIQNRGSRAVAAGALALTAFVSCVLVVTDGGRLAYNTRETTALWLDWASSLAPLGDGTARLVSEAAKARSPSTSPSGRSRLRWRGGAHERSPAQPALREPRPLLDGDDRGAHRRRR